MPRIPVSIQLYTLRDDIAQGLPQTLQRVAEAGYKNVELAGLGGTTAQELKQLLDSNGLQAPSAHVPIDVLQGDGLAKIAEDYSVLGTKTLIVPYLNDEWRQGSQGYARTAEVLNQIGSRLHTEGFEFAYHNHDFEFAEQADGKSGWDILIEQTDPGLVKIELDTYWALYAGLDPVQVMNECGSRIVLLHIKDMDPQDRSFAPVGTGTLPLDAIVEAAEKLGTVKYLVVEQDDATKETPLEAVQISMKNLKKKGYA